MPDLTILEFLSARLDEIEREANSKPPDHLYIDSVSGPVEMVDLGPGWALVTDPSRVLADVQAKRHLLELRASWQQQADRASDDPTDIFAITWQVQVGAMDAALRALATAFRDHPDYDEACRNTTPASSSHHDTPGGPRLHAAIEDRRTELGLTLSAIQAAGGPSPRWVQKLRSLDGPPTARMRAPMRRLDAALDWETGTAWALAGGKGVAR